MEHHNTFYNFYVPTEFNTVDETVFCSSFSGLPKQASSAVKGLSFDTSYDKLTNPVTLKFNYFSKYLR